MRRTPLLICVGALALAAPLTACGGGSDDPTPTTPAASGSTLTVHAKDVLKFDKDAYSAEAGTVDVSYVNDGKVDHTLLIEGVKGFELTIGGTDEGTADLKAGSYTLYCDLPGHEAAGMKATLTVK
jgi:plastocyanin